MELYVGRCAVQRSSCRAHRDSERHGRHASHEVPHGADGSQQLRPCRYALDRQQSAGQRPHREGQDIRALLLGQGCGQGCRIVRGRSYMAGQPYRHHTSCRVQGTDQLQHRLHTFGIGNVGTLRGGAYRTLYGKLRLRGGVPLCPRQGLHRDGSLPVPPDAGGGCRIQRMDTIRTRLRLCGRQYARQHRLAPCGRQPPATERHTHRRRL